MIQEVFSQNEGKFSVYFIIALTETRVMKFLNDRTCSKILLCGLSFGFVLFWLGTFFKWLIFGLAHLCCVPFWVPSFLVWLNLSWPIFGLSLFSVFPDISKRFDEID